MAGRAQPPAGAARERLRLRDGILLGALQGPAELLPISSSGHLTLVPYLLNLPYARLPGDARKASELALHLGSALRRSWGSRSSALPVTAGAGVLKGLRLARGHVPPLGLVAAYRVAMGALGLLAKRH